MNMNTQRGFAAIIAVVIGVIIIGGGVWYVSFSNETVIPESDEMMEDESATMKEDGDAMMGTDDAMMEKDDSMMMEKEETAMIKEESVMVKEKGSYETYAPEKLARANEGDVVLFFRASWCPTCKALDADIKANADNIPAGVTILDVNYDTQVDLKRKYNVTYQHTLVQVDASGNQIAKWSGSPTFASILPNIK